MSATVQQTTSQPKQPQASKSLKARLVYDGGDEVYIPPEMGTPREDQMQGTPAERLTELAGRVCYDSLGKGRPSFTEECRACGPLSRGDCQRCRGVGQIEGYHDHILNTGHGSVLEHFNFTAEIPLPAKNVETRRRLFSACCLNRPGVMVFHGKRSVRITLNLRSTIQWLNWEQELYGRVTPLARQLSFALRRICHTVAPHVISLQEMTDEPYVVDELLKIGLVEPKVPQEQWVSLFLSGSRGFSHEQVRHGDFTAISQRSTRYVDESESQWVEHPLISQWRYKQVLRENHDPENFAELNPAEPIAAEQYRYCVATLEPWLIAKGVDKTSARKQARGAARGYLGNALYTEMIFSASVAQWRWMLNQRCSDFADAEIRLIYNQVLGELQRSRYGGRFADLKLRPAKDGIGMVLAEARPRSGIQPLAQSISAAMSGIEIDGGGLREP